MDLRDIEIPWTWGLWADRDPMDLGYIEILWTQGSSRSYELWVYTIRDIRSYGLWADRDPMDFGQTEIL